jgi:16S rRNA (cytosine1402-N4)-methyltransferase
MLKQSVDGLAIQPNGIYVDATFGGGGHSREIIARMQGGTLLVFDQDEEALNNAIPDPRIIFIQNNFRYLKNFLRFYNIGAVDGILADLGVSSHDFDEAGRGFSFRFDAPLDMRMNRESRLTASHIINHYSREQLTDIFRQFGEIHNAGRLAFQIEKARAEKEILTTGELLAAIQSCIPRAVEKKYLAQVFQSLRITVNDEMTALEEFLQSSLEALRIGGRLVVIAYHSLEDRLVKNFMRSGNLEGKLEKDFYGNLVTPFNQISKKAIVPDEDEMLINPRSRSAKLRIAEKNSNYGL